MWFAGSFIVPPILQGENQILTITYNITYYCIWLCSAVHSSALTQWIKTGSSWNFSAVTNLKRTISTERMTLEDISSWLTHIVIRWSHQWKLCSYGLHATRRKRPPEQNVSNLEKWFYLYNWVKFQLYVLPHPRNTKLLRCLVRGILGNRFAKMARDSILRSYVSFN